MDSKMKRPGKNRIGILGILSLMGMLTIWGTAFAASGGQGKGDDRYVGTWKAQFKGQTFAVLKIKMENNKLGGTISVATQVSVDRNGELEQAGGELAAESPIFDLKVNGNVLSFKHKDDDDEEKLELTLTGDKQAELKYIADVTAGFKPPRPFKMTRDSK